MLALPDPARLAPRDAWALATLVDASAVLPAGGPAAAEAVRLVVDEGPPPAPPLLDARAAVGVPHRDGAVLLPAAWLRLAGALLAMEQDGAGAPRDRHGRPLSASNALVTAGADRHPVLSLLARGLHAAARDAAGARPFFDVAPWPEGRPFAAALSHDLDVASLWPGFTALRVAELARRGDAARVLRVLGAAAARVAGDPVRDGVEAALAAERDVGARSTWFIICGTPTLATLRAGDVTYRPESARVRRILRTLHEGGHEIGLHGSFETAADGARFPAQRARLARLAGAPVDGVRQHFLKRTIGETERAMAGAGFAYDSTTGFPDRNGFRIGLADIATVWDARAERALPLAEAPFCWMDRAQSKYQGVEDPARWVEDALELADRCRAVAGLWCGIWHPNLTPALGFPGAHEAYRAVVEGLATRGAWLAPVGEVVRWRAARAALRVRAVRADGTPQVEVLAPGGASPSAPSSSAPFQVRDATGTTRAEVRAG